MNDASEKEINLELFDIRGRSIYKKTYQNTGNFREELQLSNLQSGLYILNVSDGFKKSTKKMVVN